MNAEIKATKSLFDERADFSARIVSLPFIRNHAFARNDTKGAVFKAFSAFSKAFPEMPKKKTVNLRLENAVLCFGVVFTNNFAVSVGAFSLTTAREILGDEIDRTLNSITSDIMHSIISFNFIHVVKLQFVQQFLGFSPIWHVLIHNSDKILAVVAYFQMSQFMCKPTLHK